MKSSRDELAARLRAARAYSGMQQPDLGKLIGVNNDTLSKWENARGAAPGDSTVLKIADYCGVPAGFMKVGWEPFSGEMSDLEVEVRSLRAEVERIDYIAAELKDLRSAMAVLTSAGESSTRRRSEQRDDRRLDGPEEESQ